MPVVATDPARYPALLGALDDFHSFRFYQYCQDCAANGCSHSSYSYTMLTEIYIEALLVDEELADQVWEV